MASLYQGQQGPLSADAFKPTYQGSGVISFAPGSLVINGTQEAVTQGAYVVQCTDTTVVSLNATTNSRTDWVIARVYDEDYGDGSSEFALEVIEDIGGVNAATLPANSYLVASFQWIAGEVESSHSLSDRRGGVVFAGEANPARGQVGYVDVPYSAVVELAGSSRGFGVISFEADQAHTYEFSLYTGRWNVADRTWRLVVTTETQAGGNVVENVFLLVNDEQTASASVLLTSLLGATRIELVCAFNNTNSAMASAGGSPTFWVKEI